MQQPELEPEEMEVDHQDPEAAERLRAVSEVLRNGDLVDEILIRVRSPAFLILACRTSSFWTSRRRHPTFLPRFRERLALRPQPLGFYITFLNWLPPTRFVPMPGAVELAHVVSRGHFDTRIDPADRSAVLDCRKGRVLINLHRGAQDGPYVLLTPLEGADLSGMEFLPQRLDTYEGQEMWHLPDDCWGASVVVVTMSSLLSEPSPGIALSVLRHNVWSSGVGTAAALGVTGGFRLDRCGQNMEVYVLSSNGHVIELSFVCTNEIMEMRFRRIDPPNELDFVAMFNDEIIDKHVLSRGQGLGVYFVQLNGSVLSVWAMRSGQDAGNDDVGTWLLDDRVSLPQAFGHLAYKIGLPDDDEDEDLTDMPDPQYDLLRLFKCGDYGDSVFLVDGDHDWHHIFYLNIRTKRVEVVYSRQHGDPSILDLHPFTMT